MLFVLSPTLLRTIARSWQVRWSFDVALIIGLDSWQVLWSLDVAQTAIDDSQLPFVQPAKGATCYNSLCRCEEAERKQGSREEAERQRGSREEAERKR